MTRLIVELEGDEGEASRSDMLKENTMGGVSLLPSTFCRSLLDLYERVREDMRAEMEAKAAEIEAKAATEMEVKHQKMCEELDAKAVALEVKQKQVDEKYENFEKIFFELQNMRES
ncbi:hypothetical protein LXL04_002937 [Taraxacum kok-saghyz]